MSNNKNVTQIYVVTPCIMQMVFVAVITCIGKKVYSQTSIANFQYDRYLVDDYHFEAY